MSPFPIWNQSIVLCLVLTVASWPAYWYSHLLKNFPQFVVIHTVEGFGVISKTEVDVFLEFSCFFYDPVAVWDLISGSLPFLNPAWTSRTSWFMYCWSLAWRILSITLLVCEMSAVEHSLALPFFGIGMKTDLFQSCGHCRVFQIGWHIEYSTFTASSFGLEIAQLELRHLH